MFGSFGTLAQPLKNMTAQSEIGKPVVRQKVLIEDSSEQAVIEKE